MLDIRFIRDNQQIVQAAITNKKGARVDLKKLLALDAEAQDLRREIDQLNRERNLASKDKNVDKGKKLKDQLDKLETNYRKAVTQLNEMLEQVPNIPSSDTPVGQDETGNKVLRTWGEPTTFSFPPQDHLELGEKLGLIDTTKAAAVAGARFNYLFGELVLLEYALVNFALAVLTNQDTLHQIATKNKLDVATTPFIPVAPPLMIRPDVFNKMARLKPEDDRYYIESDDLYLIGSAEHTLGPLHMNEVLTEVELPKRYVAFTAAFRREAGSYGKDTRGILRVHQFDKVEMESFTSAERGIAEQNFFVAIQEYLMQQLQLPYRIIQICTGEMGGPDARQIDLETWMPGQNKYRETHTADYMTDYQARRLNTRYKTGSGQTELVHMNDATVFAIGRTLIAIMENYQRSDGSIAIPEVLEQFLPRTA